MVLVGRARAAILTAMVLVGRGRAALIVAVQKAVRLQVQRPLHVLTVAQLQRASYTTSKMRVRARATGPP